MKPRECWVSRNENSIDPDKLTHIALYEYNEKVNPMHFRQIVPINWKKVWAKYYKEFNDEYLDEARIQKLIEKAIKGEL